MLNENKRVHFIAIGGSVMHGLAIALKMRGYQVSGSDDQIFGTSKLNLSKNGLLPKPGWDENKINQSLDAVILGMHAKKDNPELLKAQSLGLKVSSYPEFIMEQCQEKQRIVIAGSHGKTSITAIIIHVLNYWNKKFDYLIGSKPDGFDNLIRLSDAPVIIIEGDEYLSSPIDPTAKFLHYNHHIGLISGISWDHMNVFPNEDNYIEQFRLFYNALPKGGSLIYCGEDATACKIASQENEDVLHFKYTTHPYVVKNQQIYLIAPEDKEVSIQVFGSHNMQNIAGAWEVLNRLAITPEEFYEAISSFKGASRRLELMAENNGTAVFQDFAHAPSKTQATIEAVKEKYQRPLVACLELHTYSSLNQAYLPQYRDKMNDADYPIVFFDPATLANKKLPPLTKEIVKTAFNNDDLKVFTDPGELESYLHSFDWQNKNLLLMSSGNFGGIDLQNLGKNIVVNNY